MIRATVKGGRLEVDAAERDGERARILEHLQIAADSWLDMVLNFRRWFRLAAGRADSLAAEAARRGRH
jgi:hypothetical protein